MREEQGGSSVLRFRKIALVVLDSVGIGAMPDADAYGDRGADTLGHVLGLGKPKIPNLVRLGLANIRALPGLAPAVPPEGAYGRMAEKSRGKDTTTGHWEMMGIVLEKAFPVFPNGFPDRFIRRFEAAVGRKVLGNKPTSGTEIIKELGPEHLKTGCPIVYTSADSVFQVAAHEEAIPVEELYRYCRVARDLLTGDLAVARVIARPFVGEPGNFRRTPRRKDYSLPPPAPTVLDRLMEAGHVTVGIGKIEDIFAGRGLSKVVHASSNADNLAITIEETRGLDAGLVFTNLVDFDMLYGHRNDVAGYAAALEEVDARIPGLLQAVGPDGLLLLTADHGCDPAFPGTDHTREYVPLLAAGRKVRGGVSLGIRETFADVGATIAGNFGLSLLPAGRSFLEEIAV
jgi:phosphopentomutase